MNPMLWISLLATLCFAHVLSASPTKARLEDRSPFSCTITIEAPREVVWRTLASEEGWKAFMGVESTIELHRDGAFEMYFLPDAPAGSRGGEGNRILSFLPNEMLSFTWNAPPQFERERPEKTWVVVRLASRNLSRTEVRLTHAGWDEPGRDGGRWSEVRNYFQHAWPRVLSALRKHCETIAPQPPPVAAERMFLYHIRPARASFEHDATEGEQAIVGEHFEYLKRATRAGRVLLAGRTESDFGGIVLFRAADEAEARAFMQADPAVNAGVFIATLHPYRLALFGPDAAVQ